jgi:hypothetical protein
MTAAPAQGPRHMEEAGRRGPAGYQAQEGEEAQWG